jgi:hypothetical protein
MPPPSPKRNTHTIESCVQFLTGTLSMNVYKKLQAARTKLHKTPLGKSGKNSFAKFNYFELSDFLPEVTAIFNELGLCEVINFNTDTATLTIHDADADGQIVFTTPLVYADMGKVQSIQNLGATHTYIRRYLYLLAMNVLENDVVDAAEPKAPPAKVAPKPEPKPEPKLAEPSPASPKQFNMKGQPRDWQLHIEGEGEWDDLAMSITSMALDLANSADDCNNIYKFNISIFEKMKLEYPQQYEILKDKFTTRKKSFLITQE